MYSLNNTKYESILHSINSNEQYKYMVTFNQRTTAKIIGVSDSTLENWRREGIGPNFKKIDSGRRGRVLYLKTDIALWLSETIETL
ncbi:hypothetical protein CP965_03760 [Halarcobacter mediterraneus]|uniref:Helix-turn-helix domain-containing protein n=1 Tax=Halarcobacter mediterraneus TaxID=2023153 RepID=A0A4Q1AYX0_9BACT|nr:helix-turn-helix domain-containing protein [Halarcobacter mediterraneus]RXK14573.1 hypothetical protein CP965_03760 [Halarcobacter mediterraneus]